MNKKLIIIASFCILVLAAASVALLFWPKVQENGQAGQNESNAVPTSTKEVEFVVVRVLPSGFSPKEVTIKKGMIVRFTNPTDTKVTLKWEGDTQYTNEAVYEGNDIATTVFDTEGVYTFSKDSNPSHMGKVTVR